MATHRDFISETSPKHSENSLDSDELHISECSSSSNSTSNNALDEQENQNKNTPRVSNFQRGHNWSKIFASAGIKPLPIGCSSPNSQELHISDCTSSSSEEEQQENQPSFLHSRKRRLKPAKYKKVLFNRLPLSPCNLNNKQQEVELKTYSPVKNDTLKRQRTPSPCSNHNNDEIEIEEISIDSTTPTGSPQREQTATELDLLVELIEKNNYAPNNTQPHKKSTYQKQKRCIKGGYVEQFRSALFNERMNQRFLTREIEMNITWGVILSVIEVCPFFSVHMAKVDVIQAENINIPSFYVILDSCIAPLVKVGSRLEAFLDAPPVYIEDKVIFIQPHRLILL